MADRCPRPRYRARCLLAVGYGWRFSPGNRGRRRPRLRGTWSKRRRRASVLPPPLLPRLVLLRFLFGWLLVRPSPVSPWPCRARSCHRRRCRRHRLSCGQRTRARVGRGQEERHRTRYNGKNCGATGRRNTQKKKRRQRSNVSSRHVYRATVIAGTTCSLVHVFSSCLLSAWKRGRRGEGFLSGGDESSV